MQKNAKPKPSAKDEDRRAAALRENLRKRKVQAERRQAESKTEKGK